MLERYQRLRVVLQDKGHTTPRFATHVRQLVANCPGMV